MNDAPSPVMVYAYLRYAEGITLSKQAADKQVSSLLLDPRVLGALAGGAVGLGSAALSGRRDEEGKKDKPWLRNALIGAGLGGLLGHFGFSGGNGVTTSTYSEPEVEAAARNLGVASPVNTPEIEAAKNMFASEDNTAQERNLAEAVGEASVGDAAPEGPFDAPDLQRFNPGKTPYMPDDLPLAKTPIDPELQQLALRTFRTNNQGSLR
jgi:hypothetical protein